MTVATIRRKPVLVTNDTPPPSPFELAAAELRALGIMLARLPGQYRVNFRNGAESTARTVETLDQALAAGRAMAAEQAEQQPNRAGPRWRRPRTVKAYNRRLRMWQLRRLRARAFPFNKKPQGASKYCEGLNPLRCYHVSSASKHKLD